MGEGNTITSAEKRIVRMKLPTLIDNGIIISTGITNEVSILISGIIHTQPTHLKLIH